MPLYDFLCPVCGVIREVLVRSEADNEQWCGTLVLMQRQPSAPGFVSLTDVTTRERTRGIHVEFSGTEKGRGVIDSEQVYR